MTVFDRTDMAGDIERYLRIFPEEKGPLEPLLRRMASGGELTQRSTLPGHVTASGIVVSNDKFLTILHPYLRIWIPPGGHLDKDESPLDAALREVEEETCVRAEPDVWHLLHRAPIDIDIHEIAANPAKGEPAHLHYDFRYLLRVCNVDSGRQAEHELDWAAWPPPGRVNLRRVWEKVRQQSAFG